jgi:hypothetical protein
LGIDNKGSCFYSTTATTATTFGSQGSNSWSCASTTTTTTYYKIFNSSAIGYCKTISVRVGKCMNSVGSGSINIGCDRATSGLHRGYKSITYFYTLA